MVENERRVKNGQPKILILNTGMWRYSRHPNYFFEQIWWLSLVLFSGDKEKWTVIGTLFNSAVMVEVVRMTEERMAGDKKRQDEWKEYVKVTPILCPY